MPAAPTSAKLRAGVRRLQQLEGQARPTALVDRQARHSVLELPVEVLTAYARLTFEQCMRTGKGGSRWSRRRARGE